MKQKVNKRRMKKYKNKINSNYCLLKIINCVKKRIIFTDKNML